VIEDVLAVIGGELIDADINTRHGYLAAYVRAESEFVISDVFEASFFTVDQITYLGPIHEAYSDVNRSEGQGSWQCRPAQPAKLQSVASTSTRASAWAALSAPALHAGRHRACRLCRARRRAG